MDLAPESREITTEAWSVLKTLLFATIMVAESALSASVFVPPPYFTSRHSGQLPVAPITPKDVSILTLRILNSLAFIITQFGGVTTTSTSGADFPELKKVFYLAVDVLSDGTDGREGGADEFVKELFALGGGEFFFYAFTTSNEADEKVVGQGTIKQAKKAFALACIEQLVPVLREENLPQVFRFCFPYVTPISPNYPFERILA